MNTLAERNLFRPKSFLCEGYTAALAEEAGHATTAGYGRS